MASTVSKVHIRRPRLTGERARPEKAGRLRSYDGCAAGGRHWNADGTGPSRVLRSRGTASGGSASPGSGQGRRRQVRPEKRPRGEGADGSGARPEELCAAGDEPRPEELRRGSSGATRQLPHKAAGGDGCFWLKSVARTQTIDNPQDARRRGRGEGQRTWLAVSFSLRPALVPRWAG